MKKLGSFCLSILLMISTVLLGLRIILTQVLLNEEMYTNIQQEVKLADAILEYVTLDLQTLMRTNNLPEELVIDLIRVEDIETVIQLQTTETIELLKGNGEVISILDPEPYIWELEPRIMNYLNEQGYKVEESGYDDLAQINKSVYELTRGDIHLFDVSTLMYSTTVSAISTLVQFILSPLPFLLIGVILICYWMVWRTDFRQIIYWLATSVFAAGLFGVVMLGRVSNQPVGISTNASFNQAMTEVILQVEKQGSLISLILLLCGGLSILFLNMEKMIKISK